MGTTEATHEVHLWWEDMSTGDVVEDTGRYYQLASVNKRPVRRGWAMVKVHQWHEGAWHGPFNMEIQTTHHEVTLLGVTDWRQDSERV